MYKRINWQNHVVQFPYRRKIEDLGGNLFAVTPDQGEILQQGTKQSAENFNHMDEAILDNALFSQIILQLEKLGGTGAGVEFEADEDDIRELVGAIPDTPFEPEMPGCDCDEFTEATDDDIEGLFR